MKYIDMHAHIFPDQIAPKVVNQLEEHYKMKWGKLGTTEDLAKSVKDANMYKTVIFSTATTENQVVTINNYIAENVNENYVGFGTLHPDFEDYKNEIKRIKALGLKGIKLHPDFQGFNIDDPKMMRIYEEVDGTLPFLIHIGDETFDHSSPKRMANALENANIRLIAAHLGGYSQWSDAQKYLVGRDIYLDTSSTLCRLNPDEAVDIIRKHGVDKILFGTDYPAMGHKEAIAEFSKLSLETEEFEKIFYKNATKLLKL